MERVLCVAEQMSEKRVTRPKAMFNINEQVKFMVYSGSRFTILPKEKWLETWGKSELTPKDINPVGYQCGDKCIGFYVGNNSIQGVEVYIAADGRPILGWVYH